jgi:hypothetical protein
MTRVITKRIKMNLYIRKLDNYNFTLAEKLDEPRVVKIKDKEIVYNYKNLPCYYGSMYGAIIGLAKHTKTKIDRDKLEDELHNIYPASGENLYMPFLEVRDDLVLANYK